MQEHKERESDFREFFSDVYEDALRFAQRRAADDRAEDAVADAILVAWRRFSEAPRDYGERRAWLFGIVRNTLLNARRSDVRQTALAVRIADRSTIADSPDHSEHVAQKVDLVRAWHRLSDAEQETLSLAIFEETTASQAARVLGISGVAYRTRLARARRSLRSQLEQSLPSRAAIQAQEAQS